VAPLSGPAARHSRQPARSALRVSGFVRGPKRWTVDGGFWITSTVDTKRPGHMRLRAAASPAANHSQISITGGVSDLHSICCTSCLTRKGRAGCVLSWLSAPAPHAQIGLLVLASRRQSFAASPGVDRLCPRAPRHLAASISLPSARALRPIHSPIEHQV